jgi:hypothetical protein
LTYDLGEVDSWRRALFRQVFLHENSGLASLPPELAACTRMKRFNVSKLPLDAGALAVAEVIKVICTKEGGGGAYWGPDGRKLTAPSA